MKPEKQKMIDDITAALGGVIVGETTSKKIAKAIASAAEKLAKKIAKIKKEKAAKAKKKAKKEEKEAKKEAKKTKKDAKKESKEAKKEAKTMTPIVAITPDAAPATKPKKTTPPKNED